MTANSLQAVLDKAVHQPEKKNAAKEPKPRTAKPRQAPSNEKFYRKAREGQNFIGGHFDPPVLQQLKIIAAEDFKTVQDLLAEALDLLFVKRGKDKIEKLVRK
jgi:hypothetical protein